MRKRDQKIDYSILFIIVSSLVFTDPGSSTMLLDVENAKSYLSPLGTMLSTGMNSGYFH